MAHTPFDQDEITPEGMGRYVIDQTQPQFEELPVELRNSEVSQTDAVKVVHEHRNKLGPIQIIKRIGLVILVTVGSYAGYRAVNFTAEVAPKPQESFDIDGFRQAVSTKDTVATGQVKSTADVNSNYSFIAGSAECDGQIKGHQNFFMRSREDGKNIRLEGKKIIVELEENEVVINEQIVSLPDAEKSCEANLVGRQGIFKDESKAFAVIAEKGPSEFSEQTEVQNPDELMSLNDGELGMQLAQSAASTYQNIGGRMLELADTGMSLEFTYNGDVIEPSTENTISVDVQADRIDLEA